MQQLQLFPFIISPCSPTSAHSPSPFSPYHFFPQHILTNNKNTRMTQILIMQSNGPLLSILLDSLQLPLVRRLQECFLLLTPVDEQLLGVTVGDMVVVTYKALDSLYKQHQRLGLHKLKRNMYAQVVKELRTRKAILEVEELEHQSERYQKLLVILIKEGASLSSTRKELMKRAFEKIRCYSDGTNAGKIQQLKVLRAKRLCALVLQWQHGMITDTFNSFKYQSTQGLQNLRKTRMTILMERHFTKIYIRNIPKEPLQIQQEGLHKMREYLSRARAEDNVKRGLINRYVLARYKQLSHAFLEIKEYSIQQQHTHSSGLKEINRKWEIEVRKSRQQKHKLTITLFGKTLSWVWKRRLRQSFCCIHNFTPSPPPTFSEFPPHPPEPISDSLIFSNVLNQYLYLLGHMPSEASASKKRSTNILKLLLKKSQSQNIKVLRKHFSRFKQILPNHSYQERLGIVKQLEELETQKEQLVTQFS